MNFIEGTVTISLETLDNLRECETLYRGIRNTASGLIERIDSEQYDEKCKEIDAMKEISDDDITRLLNEARKTLLKRSYMVDPMAIGDRHEMGG